MADDVRRGREGGAGLMRWVVGLVLLAVVAGCTSEPADPVAQSPVPTTELTPTPTPIPAAPETATVTAAEARRRGLAAVAALKRDDAGTALALIRNGADINVQDDLKDSVFLYAGAEGYLRVLEAALAHGADVTSTNRYGGTALIPASEHAHLDVIRVLLAAGVAVDHVNDLGWTALGEAVALGDGGSRSQEAVRLLLAAGADPRSRDRFGRTTLENAERLGFTEIARLLRNRY